MSTGQEQKRGRHAAAIEGMGYEEAIEKMRADARLFVADTALRGGPYTYVDLEISGQDQWGDFGLPRRVYPLRATTYGSNEAVPGHCEYHIFHDTYPSRYKESSQLAIEEGGDITIITTHDHGAPHHRDRMTDQRAHGGYILNPSLVAEPERVAEVYETEWLADLERIRNQHLGIAPPTS